MRTRSPKTQPKRRTLTIRTTTAMTNKKLNDAKQERPSRKKAAEDESE